MFPVHRFDPDNAAPPISKTKKAKVARTASSADQMQQPTTNQQQSSIVDKKQLKREKKKRTRERMLAKRKAEDDEELDKIKEEESKKRPRVESDAEKPVEAGKSLLETFEQLRSHLQPKTAKDVNEFNDDEDEPELLNEGKLNSVFDDCNRWAVSSVLAKNLQENLQISHFFPMQTNSIDKIISCTNDVCISSPTGSGKTLVFAVPVICALINRIVKRLRALILLPTRDLALQCTKVFKTLCLGTSLVVESATGQTSLEINIQKALEADILVATPGRLADLLKSSSKFTLEHLSFLVIDEADRLLSQRYQNWLVTIYESAYQNADGVLKCDDQVILRPTTKRSSTGNSLKHFRANDPVLRKILCSATLTRNPQKLAALNLRVPLHIEFSSSHHKKNSSTKIALPESLSSSHIICEREQKTMALIQLLTDQCENAPTLVFVSSVEAAHRLAMLLKLYLGDCVKEISSNQSQQVKNSVLQLFHQKKITILIGSDVVARGIDIPDLENVINYDLPNFAKGFVHRIGRVARAGKQGHAYSIVRRDQISKYRNVSSKLVFRNEPIQLEFDLEEAEMNQGKLDSCLEAMKEAVSREKSNKSK